MRRQFAELLAPMAEVRAFVQAIVAIRTEPVIVSDLEVMDQHNKRCGAQYNISEREVRGRVIHNEKLLGVQHIAGGKIQV